MTKITKHLRSVTEIKNELESNPENIRYYMGYEGYEGPEGSIDYITEKIEEHIKNKKNESTKN